MSGCQPLDVRIDGRSGEGFVLRSDAARLWPPFRATDPPCPSETAEPIFSRANPRFLVNSKHPERLLVPISA